MGVPAHRRRRPGGIQAPDRISRRSTGLEERNRTTLIQKDFSFPDSRNIWRRGNHRSPGYATDALRLDRNGLSPPAESAWSQKKGHASLRSGSWVHIL